MPFDGWTFSVFRTLERGKRAFQPNQHSSNLCSLWREVNVIFSLSATSISIGPYLELTSSVEDMHALPRVQTLLYSPDCVGILEGYSSEPSVLDTEL